MPTYISILYTYIWSSVSWLCPGQKYSPRVTHRLVSRNWYSSFAIKKRPRASQIGEGEREWLGPLIKLSFGVCCERSRVQCALVKHCRERGGNGDGFSCTKFYALTVDWRIERGSRTFDIKRWCQLPLRACQCSPPPPPTHPTDLPTNEVGGGELNVEDFLKGRRERGEGHAYLSRSLSLFTSLFKTNFFKADKVLDMVQLTLREKESWQRLKFKTAYSVQCKKGSVSHAGVFCYWEKASSFHSPETPHQYHV